MIPRPLWLLPVAALVACSSPAAPDQHEQWTCPMHPQYVSDRPGNCPICGMKLVKKEPAPAPAPTGTAATPDGATARAAGGPPDDTLQLSPERQRLLGVRTVEATLQPLAAGLRTTGRVVVDERRVQRVTARFEGYVEKLYADFTGKQVAAGDPIASIYSPELLATEQEYLLARKSSEALAASGLPDAARAARDRLRLLGISEGEIAGLEKRGTAERALTLHAPISGFITQKTVVAGSRVNPAEPLVEITDLSRVWVLADVYENELPRLKLGQRAVFTLAYWPDKKWEGKVSYILPTVDEKTRTVKVRIEVANPRYELKPEMYGDVVLDTAPRQALTVPEDAVLITGTRTLVFVVLDDGRLAPRAIETGAHANGVYEVKRGLEAGAKVAAGASFLLDSESKLRGVAEPGGAPVPPAPTAGPHAGHVMGGHAGHDGGM